MNLIGLMMISLGFFIVVLFALFIISIVDLFLVVMKSDLDQMEEDYESINEYINMKSFDLLDTREQHMYKAWRNELRCKIYIKRFLEW